MSGKSVTELVSNFRRPFEGEGHVWLATRGPGEFVGKLNCSLTFADNHRCNAWISPNETEEAPAESEPINAYVQCYRSDVQ